MPRRPNIIAIRLTDDGLRELDEAAAQEERSRSDMARILIAEAIQLRKQAER
jgi:metal-responsive CopG/Arc/MetJ family transcriptional regulator